MSRLDFHVEFYSEVEELAEELRLEVESRLAELAAGQTDIIGASVALEELTQEETPHFYQARIVAYIKPENMAAVEKADTPQNALKGALAALEEQVRELRGKFRQRWERSDVLVDMDNIYQLTARELYDAFADQADPARVVNRTRIDIATELMTQEGLKEEAAYYVADQVLAYAQELIDSQAGEGISP